MCDKRERLMDYLYDEAAPADRHEVETHLESCGDCRNEMRAFRRVREDLLAWDVPAYESVWTPFAPTPIAPWYRQVPAWALTAAAGLMLLLGTAGGFAGQALLPAAAALEAGTVAVTTPVEPVAAAVLPASLVGLDESQVRLMIQREISQSGVMRVADTAPGLSPAQRQQLLNETESLVYEQHKQTLGRVSQFVSVIQTERAIDLREYQKEIGTLKTQVEELQRTVNFMITAPQNAKGQQQ
jgi:hypothetical protein